MVKKIYKVIKNKLSSKEMTFIHEFYSNEKKKTNENQN